MRNRRLRAGQPQRQAAAQMGVLLEVYDRWERDQTVPPVAYCKGFIAFLGTCRMPPNGGGAAPLIFKARSDFPIGPYASGRSLWLPAPRPITRSTLKWLLPLQTSRQEQLGSANGMPIVHDHAIPFTKRSWRHPSVKNSKSSPIPSLF